MCDVCACVCVCVCVAHTVQVKSVVLINCGGTVDLLQLFEPDNEQIQFYIIDR